MCRNHSHLIAEFLGEDTSAGEPKMLFALRSKEVMIESYSGSRLLIPTSGLLYLPSYALGGLYLSGLPAKEEPSLSLSFIEANAMTTSSPMDNSSPNSLTT